MKTSEREEARRMRRDEGRSVREIATMLGVSRSSASLWVRDIELTAEQHEILRQRNVIYDAQRTGSAVWSARCRAVREEAQMAGRMLARLGDPVHSAGCMLYWAEGSKSLNTVGLSNSDPEITRFFLAFLRRYFSVADEKVRIRCNLFADHVERQDEIEKLWLDALELPPESLRRSIVNFYSKHSARKRKNMLPYGTCTLVVGDVRIIQSIYGSIQEYAGFDRPEWLG